MLNTCFLQVFVFENVGALDIELEMAKFDKIAIFAHFDDKKRVQFGKKKLKISNSPKIVQSRIQSPSKAGNWCFK